MAEAATSSVTVRRVTSSVWRDRWTRRHHATSTLRVDVREIREDLDALADELAWFFLPASEQSASA